MKLLVVYSSKTGNTKKVAMAIGETLGVEPVAVTENPSPEDYDAIVAGFWVDKGTSGWHSLLPWALNRIRHMRSSAWRMRRNC